MGYLHDTDILGYMIHTYILDKILLKGKVRCLNEPEISVCRQFSVQKARVVIQLFFLSIFKLQ